MKKTIATLSAALLIATPFLLPLTVLAQTTTYTDTSGGNVDMNSALTTPSIFYVYRLGGGACAVSTDCYNFWTGLTAGQQFTISGTVGNDGTYTFESLAHPGASGLTNGMEVTILEQYPSSDAVEHGNVTFTLVGGGGGGGGGGAAPQGFIFLSASSSAAAVPEMGNLMEVTVGNAIFWTVIAIAVPLSFFVIQQILIGMEPPRDKRKRR